MTSALAHAPWLRRMIVAAATLAFLSPLGSFGGGEAHAGAQRWTSNGPEGGYIYTLALDPSDPSIVYAGTMNGLYRSTNGGDSWRRFDIAALPVASIYDVVVDPASSTTIYVGANGGFYVTTNGGATWTRGATPYNGQHYYPQSFKVIPTTPRTIVGVARDSVVMSTDGGLNWSFSGTGIPSNSMYDLDVRPDASSTMLAAGSGIYRSTDDAASWSSVASGMLVYDVTFAPSDGSTAYAATFTNVLKSTNGGVTWTSQVVGLGSTSVYEVAVHPSDPSTAFAATSRGVYRTANGGTTWTAHTSGLPSGAFQEILLDPSTPTRLWTGHDGYGGVFRSLDAGATWAIINSGLMNTPINGVVVDAQTPSTIYTLTQNSSTRVWKSTDRGSSWSPVASDLPNSGVMVELELDPTNASKQYIGGFSAIYRTSNGGANWSTAVPPVSGFVNDISIHPSAPSTLYAAVGSGVAKSTNGGQSWVAAGTGLPGSQLQDLAIDPSNPSTVYAALWGAGVYKSTDGGGSWSPASTGLPESTLASSISADPADPTRLYLGSSTSPYVFRSTDGGATWTGSAGGTNVSPVEDIVADPVRANRVYAVNSLAMHVSNDGGLTWGRSTAGLTGFPRVMTVDPTGEHLYVGTWYDGVFEMAIEADLPTNPSVSFPNHPAGGWSHDRTLDVVLSGAADAGSGVDGFSYIMDASPTTVPDTVKEAEETRDAVTMSERDPGTYYFHLRTGDNAGNWTQPLHFGPFNVETTAPVVTSLSSSSHAPNTWSADNTMSISFSSVDFGGSGVDGYSIEWDESGSTVPDAVKDVEETATTATSGELTDGSGRWVHIRAIDNAGNVSPAVHLGPFRIDASSPTGAPGSTPAAGWISSQTVEIDLMGIADAHSGLAGVSFQWDQLSDSLPDDELDAADPDSGTLGEGDHYFHLRARDNVGNWSDTVHLGPFTVDLTPPSPPILSSLSHTISTASNDATVDVSWSGASDGGSGIAGYSYGWSNAEATQPSTETEAGSSASSATSDPLDDGEWWFHIRAEDGVGHPSVYEVIGPFVIDTSGPGAVTPGTLAVYQKQLRFDVSWKSDDATAYEVSYRRAPFDEELGATTPWALSPTATSGRFAGAAGNTYCFEVVSLDALSNRGDPTDIGCTAVPVDDRSLQAAGGWTKQTGTGYYLRTFRVSSRRNATLTLENVHAEALALVATKCSGCGKVNIMWNGLLAKTVSLQSATTKKKQVVLAPLAAPGTGTVTIVIISSGKPVKIDGLGVMAPAG